MYSRHLLLTLTLLLGCLAGRAQTFSVVQGNGVPNDSAWHYFNITVSGLSQAQLSTTYGLARACINITHPNAADLNVRLLGPDSMGITLVSLPGTRVGGFTNTCFAMNATRSILNGAAPFAGSFVSQQFFSFFNQGRASNGTWMLAVRNESATEQGVFNSGSITFQANPPADPTNLRLCTETNPTGCQCPDGSDTCDLLPDMTASATKIIGTPGNPGNYIQDDSIRLSNGTPNIGWGPLEIHGTAQCYCDTVRVQCSLTTCPDGSQPKERVIQRIYRREGDQMRTRDVEVGFMRYHPSHGHVHVDGWAVYTLRVNNGQYNPRNWPIIAKGGKTSYCLVNLGACTEAGGDCKDLDGRSRGPSNIPNYGFGTVTGCQRDQGIFTGSLDIYSSGMTGQTIPLAGVCSGDYYIVSETDPENMFIETNDTNNVVAVPIRLNRPNAGVMPSFRITPIGQLYAFAALNLPQGTRYVWDFGDGNVDSTNNPVIHMYQTTGSFRVKLTYKGQTCGNTVSEQQVVITSVSKTLSAGSFDLKVQPNPANDRSMISFNLPNTDAASIYVVNALGQKVLAYGEADLKPGMNSLPLGSRLRKGLYTAVLETSMGRTAAKFVVE